VKLKYRKYKGGDNIRVMLQYAQAYKCTSSLVNNYKSATAKQFKTVGPKSFDKQTMQHTKLHKSSIRSISVTFTVFRKTNGKVSLHH